MNSPGERSKQPAVVVACALWWLVVLASVRGGAPALLDDAWEYALVARHLFEGWGFRTTAIHPPLWALHDVHGTVPMLVHGPMLPCLLAPFLLISGPALVGAIPWIAAAFATGAAGLLHRVALRRVSPAAAAAAVLLFTSAPLTMRAVLSDASFVIGAFWMALAVDRLTSGRAFSAGLACGAGALVRPEFVLIAPLLALPHAGMRMRIIGGFLIPWLPWAWHQSVSSGIPAFNLSAYLLLAFTRAYPDLTVLRSFDLGIDRWHEVLRQSLPGLWQKWLHAFPRALKHVLTAPAVTSGWLGFVALAGLRPGSPAAPGSVRGLALTMLVPVLLMVVAQHRPEFVMPLLPVWALLAVLGGEKLLARAGVRRPAVLLAAAALLSIPPALVSLGQQAGEIRRRAAWLERERQDLGRRVGGAPAAAIVFTDAPGFASWETGRTTLWVTEHEWRRLYAEAGAGQRTLPQGFPERLEDAVTWFHENPRAPQP